MKIEVLLSTMNIKSKQEAMKLFQNMNIKGNAVMINQITDKTIEPILEENESKRIYSYYEKGLSKSRNIAMKKLNGDIGIFADDDVIYNDNYEEIIKRAYEKYPDADIIGFYVESTNAERANKKQRTHKANYISLMRIRSFQITFRKGLNVEFDERFGPGAKYKCGEENILLYDCRKLGKKIYYVDEQIGIVEHKTSTWFTKMDKEYLEREGAILYHINPKIYLLLILQYAIRKRKEHKMKVSVALKHLYQGVKEYKRSYIK